MMDVANTKQTLSRLDWLYDKFFGIDASDVIKLMVLVPKLHRLILVCNKLCHDKVKKEISNASSKLIDQIKILDLKFNLDIGKGFQRISHLPLLKKVQSEFGSLILHESKRGFNMIE